jgi:hypothetical protein
VKILYLAHENYYDNVNGEFRPLLQLLGITKLDKEKNQCIREKMGAQNIVKEIKQYQKKWLQHVQTMDTNRIPRQALRYRPEGRKTWDDQRRDGGTNSTLRNRKKPNP